MENLYKNLPKTPGVYLMKDVGGGILYIGKAANLKRRVSSYFLRVHDRRIETMVECIRKIDHIKTDTALEALILEAQLIKKYQPPFNILEKDDKSFLYIIITKEQFPRVLAARGKDLTSGSEAAVFKKARGKSSGSQTRHLLYERRKFGPFVSAGSAREALRIIRRIFPFNTHAPEEIAKFEAGKLKPCFNHQIGLCPGVCAEAIGREDYLKNIRNIKLFFSGRKKLVARNLARQMKETSKELEFEKAARIRRQLFALRHIQDVALLNDSEIKDLKFEIKNSASRIEGYDISNISGQSAVGSMAVFEGGQPDKAEYRKFRIRQAERPNDTAMLAEVLERRLEHKEWPFPALILVDGGLPQVNAAKNVLARRNLKIPVAGIAKGPARNKNELIGRIPVWAGKDVLIRLRDEAHRFAIVYHKKLRGRNFLAAQRHPDVRRQFPPHRPPPF